MQQDEKIIVGFLCKPSTNLKEQEEETEPVASDFCQGISRGTQTEAASSSSLVAERCALNERLLCDFVTQTDLRLVTISVTWWPVYLSV